MERRLCSADLSARASEPDSETVRTEKLIAVTADRIDPQHVSRSDLPVMQDARVTVASKTEDVGNDFVLPAQVPQPLPETSKQILLHVAVLELSIDKLRGLGIEGISNSGDFQLFSAGELQQFQNNLHKVARSNKCEAPLDSPLEFVQTLKAEGLATVVAQPVLVTVSGRPAQLHMGGELPTAVVSFERPQVGLGFQSLGAVLDVASNELSNDRVRMDLRLRVTEPQNVQQVTRKAVSGMAFETRQCCCSTETKFDKPVGFIGPACVRAKDGAAGAGGSDDHKTYMVIVSPESVDAIPCARE